MSTNHKPGPGRPKGQAIRPGMHPQAVPPRQHNVMQGTYQPTRDPVLRNGALDFKQVRSVGCQC